MDHIARLSLIVATTGRLDTLERLFLSLSSSAARDFEVILVDQSAAGLSARVRELAERFSRLPRILYLRDEGRGLSRARNLGLQHANGTCLGFPDDDCWYPVDTIGRVLSFFAEHPAVGILSGQYTEPDISNPSFATVAGDLSVHNLNTRTSSVGTFLNRRGLHGQPIVFDERIGAGTELPAGEETDLLLRLLLGGSRGVYDPSLTVYHLIQRDKVISSKAFVQLRMAYWFVIGKNYRPLFTEAKVARGALSCLLKRQRYGKAVALRALLAGLRLGLAARGASLPKPGVTSDPTRHSQ